MAEHPRKRSNPAQLLRDKRAIINDFEQRLPVDAEDPESQQKRQKKYGIPPAIKGGPVIGVKKNTTA